MVAGLAKRLEQHGAKRFSAVVAATPFIGTLFGGIAKRVAVISNYPMIGELAPQNHADSEERDSVCYVGGINIARGIKEAIKAIEKRK